DIYFRKYFRKNGHIWTEQEFRENLLYASRDYDRAPDGRLMEVTRFAATGEKVVLEHKSYAYNEAGGLREMQHFNEDRKLVRKTLYGHNEHAGPFPVEEHRHDRQGNSDRISWVKKWERTYSPDGKLTEMREILDDKLLYHKFYEKGKLVRQFEYQRSGAIKSTQTHVYDPQGHLLESVEKDENEAVKLVTRHSYDGAGHRRNTEILRNGSTLIWWAAMKHDENGRLTSERSYASWFDGDGIEQAPDTTRPPDKIITYRRQSDAQGNRIREERFENGIRTFLEMREFKYF
ncbi:MAG: hypothetical protein AAF570_07070, partial [Bacteroidota bacterium]